MLHHTKKKRLFFSIVAVFCIFALLLGLFLGSGTEVQARANLATVQVIQGDIAQTVTATGHLSTSGAQQFHIPANLQIEEVYVQAGDIVQAGQALASFNLASIHSQIAHIQEELNRLDEEIAEIQSQTSSRTITAGVSGRLDEIFAEVGDSVTDVMIEHGALAHIVIEGVDMPIAITGTSGVITRVHLSADANVGPNTVLFTLESVETLPAHSALFRDRTEHAAVLAELISLSQTGTLFAPFDGIIESVLIGDSPSGGGNAPSMPNMPGGFPPMFMGMSQSTQSSEVQLVRVSNTREVSLEDVDPPSGSDTSPMQAISSLDSLNFQAPVVGMVPQSTLVGTGFQADIQWLPDHTAFSPGTIYRAMVFLQANEGFYFSQSVLDTLVEGHFPAENASILGVELFGTNLVVMLSFPATDSPSDPPSTGPNFPGITLPPGLIPDFNMPSMPSFNMPSFSMPSMPSMDMGALQTGNTNLSTPAFLIAAGDIMELRVTIDERDILSLAIGQEAEILLDALPGVRFYGEIHRINIAGTTSGGSARYTVELLLPRAPEMLPAMSASAVIITHVAEEVLLLPVSAIQEIAGREFVFTAESSAGLPTNEQNIVTGISDGLLVEIVSGLGLGDTVYYEQRSGFSFPHWGPGPGWGGSSN